MKKLLLSLSILSVILLEGLLSVEVVNTLPLKEHFILDGTLIFTGLYGILLLMMPILYFVQLDKNNIE